MGARNQLEGGMIMATSWVLKEQVRFCDRGVASTTWADYPILRFSETPKLAVDLIGSPDSGLGEAAMGPCAAAIGNALGARIRDLPFPREKVAEVLARA